MRDPNDPRVIRYIEGQLKPQLRELIVNYDPALLWFDGEWVPWWTEEHGKDLETFCRKLKPDLIINNRVGKRLTTDGDFDTSEGEIPPTGISHRLWETCMTLNDTWGYKKNDHHWKQSPEVVAKLREIRGKGGNFLLNVGPDGNGVIPAETLKILHETGKSIEAKGEVPNRGGICSLSLVLRGEGRGEGRVFGVALATTLPTVRPLAQPFSPAYRGEGGQTIRGDQTFYL